MKMKGENKYFRVVTSQDNGRAEMYLYGYIGQDFWWDEDMDEESITDLAFVRALKELEKDNDEIHIRINSPGGSVYHGDPIISAMRNSKATIHTYNDGMAASMAADIWIAGDVRHMAENAKMMIHSTGTIAIGTAKDMRSAADMLDKFDSVAISMLAKVLKVDEADVKEMFYDYEDHWLTAKEVAELGLIEKVEEYEVQTPPADAEKMSYADLVRSFGGKIEIGFDEKSRQLLTQFTSVAAGMIPGKVDAVTPTEAGKTFQASSTEPNKEIEITPPAQASEGATLSIVEALAAVMDE